MTMRAVFVASLAAAACARTNIVLNGVCAGDAAELTPHPNKEQLAGRCNVQKLVRYVEADWPPMDDLDAETDEVVGLLTDLWAYMCANTTALEGVACHSVRDRWDAIWTADGYPGHGITHGVYDFAGGTVVTNLRKQSGAYSHYLFEREGFYFVANASRGSAPVAPDGAGERIATICSWGSAPLILAQYSAAEEFVCASDVDDLFALLHSGGADVATVDAAEWSLRSRGAAGHAFVQAGGMQTLDYGATQENAIAFYLAKDNVCALGLLNEALEEVMASPWWDVFCEGLPFACYHLPHAPM